MDPNEPEPFHEDGQRLAGLVGLVFGALMHLIVGAFVLPSGLVVAWWAWLVLVALWVLGARLLWTWRNAPVRALLVPAAMAAIWWATLAAGGAWLGWTP